MSTLKANNRHPKNSPFVVQKKNEKKISVARTRALWEKMGKTQSSDEIKKKRGATTEESGVCESFHRPK